MCSLQWGTTTRKSAPPGKSYSWATSPRRVRLSFDNHGALLRARLSFADRGDLLRAYLGFVARGMPRLVRLGFADRGVFLHARLGFADGGVLLRARLGFADRGVPRLGFADRGMPRLCRLVRPLLGCSALCLRPHVRRCHLRRRTPSLHGGGSTPTSLPTPSS